MGGIKQSPSTGQYFFEHDDGVTEPVEYLQSKSTGRRFWKGQDGQLNELPQQETAQAPPPASEQAPAPVEAPQAQTSSPGMFRGITDAMGQGYTMGLSRPVSAAGGAVGRMLGDVTEGRDAQSFGTYYKQVSNKLADEDAAFKREHPVPGYGTELVGGIINPASRLAGSLVSRGGNIASRTLRGIGTSAPLGAAYSAATARPGEELEMAAFGGAAGATIAGLAIPVVELSLGLGRGILQKAIDKFGGNVTAATQKIGKVLMDMGGGDIRRGLDIAKQRLAFEGPGGVLADALGLRGQRLARGAVNVPGEGSQLGDDFVNARVRGRGARLQTAADEIAPNEFHPTIDRVSGEQRVAAKPLYEEAFAPVSDPAGRMYAPWDQRLQNFLDDPIIKQGMAKGIRTQQLEALADDVPFNFKEYAVKGFDDAGEIVIDGTPNLRSMDAAKRGIDEILEGYRDKTTGKLVLDDMGRAIEEVRKALVAKLDDITTIDGRSAYAEARASWAGPAQMKDAAWKGRDFMKGDVEVTEKIFKGMSPAEQDMFKLGMRREVSQMINTDTQSALTKFDPKKVDLWNRIEAILDPGEFLHFRAGITRELNKAKAERLINPRANSQTAGLQEDIAEMSRAPSALTTIAESILTRNPMGAVNAAVKAPVNWLRSPNPKTARDLVGMLLDLDPVAQQGTLRELGGRKLAQDLAPYLSKNYATNLASMLSGRAGALAQPTQGLY